MEVREGDRVKWVSLFTDKKTPVVAIPPRPAGRLSHQPRCQAGTAVGGDRGGRRRIRTVPSSATGYRRPRRRHHVRQQLVESGQWTALRTRPYSKIPPRTATPRRFFVTHRHPSAGGRPRGGDRRTARGIHPGPGPAGQTDQPARSTCASHPRPISLAARPAISERY